MIWCDLRKILEERDMTQRDLARLVKAHDYTISRLCNNNFKKVDFRLLDDICKALNIHLYEIIKYRKD